ncbi:uncharacterized protein LOC144125680 [Amblyomma americanum]
MIYASKIKLNVQNLDLAPLRQFPSEGLQQRKRPYDEESLVAQSTRILPRSEDSAGGRPKDKEGATGPEQPANGSSGRPGAGASSSVQGRTCGETAARAKAADQRRKAAGRENRAATGPLPSATETAAAGSTPSATRRRPGVCHQRDEREPHKDVDLFEATSTECLQTGRPIINEAEATLDASDFTTATQEDGTGFSSPIPTPSPASSTSSGPQKRKRGHDKAFKKEIGILGELASKRADASELFGLFMGDKHRRCPQRLRGQFEMELLQVAARYVDNE